MHRCGQCEYQCNQQMHCYIHNVHHCRHEFAVSCTHDHKHPLHSNTYTCHTHMYLEPSEHNPLQLSQQSLLPSSEVLLLYGSIPGGHRENK